MSSSSITYSTELMENYLQAEILAPEAKFEALQTDGGASLLFSIGTDHALYVTEEVPGVRSGWQRRDLSSAQIAKDFPNQSNVTCKDFASAQSTFPPRTSIHLAMVVSDAHNDHLYLSLENSDADTSWTSGPKWVAYPFDDRAHPRDQVKIAGVFLSEATDAEYIVVDVIRDPSSPEALIFRYYIDLRKTDGYAWHSHDLAIDLEAGRYASTLGRRQGQKVDGTYSAGQVGGVAQFIYQGLYNPFDRHGTAKPCTLKLPGRAIPDAIAACRKADNTSDLYATANGTLYYFRSDQQQDGAVAVELFASPLFNGVRSLFAAVSGGTVMVWGLNGDDEVFYTTCALSQLTAGGVAWSVPLPILSGVEQVTPYIDRAYSANTFFAHTGQNELTKATKSPATSVWTFRKITLDPPTTTTPAQRFSSYTTRVQVSGPDGQPAPGATVTLSSTNVTSVHVNSLYYVIGPSPIHVKADAVGVVTIVEPLETVAGARLTVGIDGAQATINPMDKAVQKLVALTTQQQLSTATITNPDGTTKLLVPPGTNPDVLQTVADGNAQLAQAYSAVLPAHSPLANHRLTLATAPAALASATRPPSIGSASSLGSADSVLVDAGDLFSWLAAQFEKAVDYVVKLVEDAATGVWNFVVTLPGQVYHCVLDCVEKVAGAAQWLFSAIRTAAEDLLKYLEFLFEWGDMRRTKEVVKNIVKRFLEHEVDQIEVVKGQFDQMIADAEKAIDSWAGVGDWSGLGTDGRATAKSRSTPSIGQTAPGSLLAHHYQANVGGTTYVVPGGPVEPSSDPIQVLLDAISKEADTIGDAIVRLQTLAAEADSMALEDLLKALVAIIADVVLESAKNVIDALFDILYDIAKAAVALLDTPIHIPVISDIMKGIGVPEFSVLDAICWVVAVPVTIGYKAVHGAAPFPDGPGTTALISAADYPALLHAFATMPPVAGDGPAPRRRVAFDRAAIETRTTVTAVSLPPSAATAVHITGHAVSGFSALVSAVLSGFEAAQPNGDNPFSTPSAVFGVLGGISGGVANALVPHYPVENATVAGVGNTTLAIRLLCKVIFSGPAQSKFAGSANFKSFAVSDGRGVGAVVDAVLVIPELVCTCWHFYELSEKPAGPTRSIAIVDETSSVTSDISRVSYAVAVNSKGVPQAAAIGVMTVANVCTGGLQIAETVIH